MSLDNRDNRVHKGQLVLLAPQVLQVNEERKDKRVAPVSVDYQVHLAETAHLEPEVNVDRPESQVHKDPLGHKEHLDPAVNKVKKEHVVKKDSLGFLVGIVCFFIPIHTNAHRHGQSLSPSLSLSLYK